MNRPKPQQGFELHEHSFITGPRSKSGYGKNGKWHVSGETIRHSHPGGSTPHTHEHTGPSCFRVDKYTVRPNSEQLPSIPIPKEDLTFDVIYCGAVNGRGTGGALATAERMMRTFRLRPIVKNESGGAA
jgi:hypothetical protein